MPTFDPANIFMWAYNFLGWWLTSLGLAPEFALFVQLFAAIGMLATTVLLIPIFTIWLERKDRRTLSRSHWTESHRTLRLASILRRRFKTIN